MLHPSANRSRAALLVSFSPSTDFTPAITSGTKAQPLSVLWPSLALFISLNTTVRPATRARRKLGSLRRLSVASKAAVDTLDLEQPAGLLVPRRPMSGAFAAWVFAGVAVGAGGYARQRHELAPAERRPR